MREDTSIRFTVQIPQQQIQSHIMHYSDEIAENIKLGAEEALKNFNRKIIESAKMQTEIIIKDMVNCEVSALLHDIFYSSTFRNDLQGAIKKALTNPELLNDK